MRASRWSGLLLAGLAALGLLVALVELRSYVLLHDEGLVLGVAARMGDGEWPYRDFWWNYGPGQPALLALLERLTGGPSLLTWRLVWAGSVAGIALAAFALARRHTGLGWALGAWAATLLLVVVGRLPHPNVTVALLALLAVGVAGRRPGAAGALVGVALLFRPEVGAFAVLAAMLAAPGARGRVLAAAAGIGALLWLPFIIAAGPGPILDQTLGFDLTVQSAQRLPLPTAVPPGAGPVDALHALLPTLLLLAALAAGLAIGARAARGRAPAELLALVPLLAGGALYLAGRADLFHLVSLAAALPLALALLGGGGASRRPVAAVLCVAALGLMIADGATRRLDIVRGDTSALAPAPGPAADGVRMDPADAAALARIRAELDRRAPGRAIWVGNARHDRISSGATLAYVLLGRRNGTRYDVLQPGVVTRAGVQREIVRRLERGRLPVVEWRNPGGAAREANAAGRGGGAEVLDRALARGYRPVLDAGDWRLLMPRAPSAAE